MYKVKNRNGKSFIGSILLLIHGRFLKYNTISIIQTQNGGIWTWGYQMCKKIYIDPYTEEVVNVVKAKDQTEFKNMIKEEMGIELGFDLKLNDRDFTGFTEEQGCCTFKCDKS